MLLLHSHRYTLLKVQQARQSYLNFPGELRHTAAATHQNADITREQNITQSWAAKDYVTRITVCPEAKANDTGIALILPGDIILSRVASASQIYTTMKSHSHINVASLYHATRVTGPEASNSTLRLLVMHTIYGIRRTHSAFQVKQWPTQLRPYKLYDRKVSFFIFIQRAMKAYTTSPVEASSVTHPSTHRVSRNWR